MSTAGTSKKATSSASPPVPGVSRAGVPMPARAASALASAPVTPIPAAPTMGTSRANRKTASIIVAHAPADAPIVPNLRDYGFATHASNAEWTRNVDSRFMAHPATDVAKWRLAADLGLLPGGAVTGVSSTTVTAPLVDEDDDGDETTRPSSPQPDRIAVMHPGSRWIRAGWSDDLMPSVTIPSCVARRTDPTVDGPRADSGPWVEDDEYDRLCAQQSRRAMDEYLKEMVKVEGIRTPANVTSMITNSNTAVRATNVPAMNDLHHVEFRSIQAPLTNPHAPTILVGEEAMQLDDETRRYYPLRYPIYAKSANTTDYASPAAWHSDMAALMDRVLELLGCVTRGDRARTRIVLVVPDLMDVRIADEMLSVLLLTLGCPGVVLACESSMACLGSGLSTGTVIDIGAQATSIGVVENGDLVDSARILVGGDDMTQVLLDLLRETANPIARYIPESIGDISPLSVPRWDALVREIKEKWCTSNVKEVTVQQVECVVRQPGVTAAKVVGKVFAEPFLAPLCLFFPWLVNVKRKLRQLKQHATWLTIPHPPVPFPIWNTTPNVAAGWEAVISWGSLPPGTPPTPGLVHRCALTAQLLFLDQVRADICPRPPPPAADAKRDVVPQPLGFPGISAPLPSDIAQAVEGESTGAATKAAVDPDSMDVDPPSAMEQAPPPIIKLVPGLPDTHSHLGAYARTWVAPPLDGAVHALLHSLRPDDRIRKHYGAILLVGGGAKVPGFATRALESRLRATFPGTLAATHATAAAAHAANPNASGPYAPFSDVQVAVALPPRDMDPAAVMWKGGSVLARLECVNEMWIGVGEWKSLGAPAVIASRCGIVFPGATVVGGSVASAPTWFDI
ncbi:hypothetical protein BC828DRAFT_377589 [Blastocladiella britannica]|nr:hypothetical protein BC828DRAFT_377589 [Blastocladiella britannica]